MMVVVASLPFLLAACCAATMGFAIQRGATCAVAAVGDVVNQRSGRRLTALAETSLWVAGGLIAAHAIGLLPMLPAGYAVSGWTIVGGALLGLGAFINRACVFGSIAQLGSGHMAYLLTPVGFYIGAVTAPALFAPGRPAEVHDYPLLAQLPLWVVLLFAAYALWRLYGIFRDPHPEGGRLRKAWAPHEATILIGITFVILMVAVGAWAYTDLLSHIARGMAPGWQWQAILFIALLAGASAGGWVGNGGLLLHRPGWPDLLRCLVGGTLMGWGGLLIPGSNDGLILVGLPMLWPYAWVAIVTMCLTIWAAIAISRALRGT